jgi:hypothetical protein
LVIWIGHLERPSGLLVRIEAQLPNVVQHFDPSAPQLKCTGSGLLGAT